MLKSFVPKQRRCPSATRLPCTVYIKLSSCRPTLLGSNFILTEFVCFSGTGIRLLSRLLTYRVTCHETSRSYQTSERFTSYPNTAVSFSRSFVPH